MVKNYDLWKLDSPEEETEEAPEPDWDAIREARDDSRREREERE